MDLTISLEQLVDPPTLHTTRVIIAALLLAAALTQKPALSVVAVPTARSLSFSWLRELVRST